MSVLGPVRKVLVHVLANISAPWDSRTHDRHFVIMYTNNVTIGSFRHTVTAGTEDCGIRLDYSWVSLQSALDTLVSGHDVGLAFVKAGYFARSMMAPTVLRDGAYRLFFFSREEKRMHVHISHPDGEAKFWLEPEIEIAIQSGLSSQQVGEAERLVHAHLEEIVHAWHKHFGS